VTVKMSKFLVTVKCWNLSVVVVRSCYAWISTSFNPCCLL